MNISSFTVRRPVLVCMATMIVILLGAISFFKIPIELMPDTSIPTLSVRAWYPGAGPTETEKLLTRPIEDSLSSIEGLKYLTSRTYGGYSRIRLVFDWGTDLQEALRDVQQKIDKVERRFPEDIKKPEVSKYDANDLPVIVFGITSEDNQVELTRKLDDEISPLITRIDGVGDVEIIGGTSEEVQVVMDLKKLKALKLSVSEVATLIKRQNYVMSAGRVETGLRKLDLKVSADVNSIWKLKNTVVKTLSTGKIFLYDVASVSMSPAKNYSISYVNGTRGMRLAVNKVSGANTVRVAKDVKEAIAQFSRRNKDIRITEIFNTAEYIENSVRNVNFSVLYGGFLAIVVLIVFLHNLRSTLVISVSIPISVIATFALIYFNGLTLNLMTIGGLGLGIGMLVDNAIVVLENIMRLRHSGYSLFEAAIKGGNEVQSSIIASTITTLIVFLPVIFLEGVTSLLFKELAIVVAFSMVVSLGAAILLIPTLSSLLIRDIDDPETHVEHGVWGILAKLFEKLEVMYTAILKESLQSRAWTIVICLLMLGSALALIPKIGSEFMPSADSGEIRLYASMTRGTQLEVMEETMVSLLKTLEEEFPQIENSISFIRDDVEANRAFINLSLVPASQRAETARTLLGMITRRFNSLPGVSVRGSVRRSPFAPKLPNSSGHSVEIEVRGYNLSQFGGISDQIQERLEAIDGVQEVQVPEYRLREEKLVKIDKVKTAELGISLQQLGEEISSVLKGTAAGTFLRNGQEYPIKLTVEGHEQVTVDDILTMTINNRSDEPIMFNNLLYIEDYEGPAVIDRDNRQRIVRLPVQFDEDYEESFVIDDIESSLADFPVPAGFSVIVGGNYQQQKESNRDLMVSLGLVVVLIYMVMAAQFESLLHPFVIMFSVPLAAIGVLWILYLTGTTFNMQSNMGCVMLAGIVVNNAILLVDQTNMLRDEGMQMTNAIIEAGRRRLRPILMTTATTVLGLLPLALGIGDGGEAQAPMARAVMGGLLSSTFITLVLVPVIYSIFEHRSHNEV